MDWAKHLIDWLLPQISRRAKLQSDLEMLNALKAAGIENADLEDSIHYRVQEMWSPTVKAKRREYWLAQAKMVLALVCGTVGATLWSVNRPAAVIAWLAAAGIVWLIVCEFRATVWPRE